MWNDMENMEEIKSNSEKIWKIQKKIVKRYEKHGKYGRIFFFTKQWRKDMEHMEEKKVE